MELPGASGTNAQTVIQSLNQKLGNRFIKKKLFQIIVVYFK
jgi:hypothetical protein